MILSPYFFVEFITPNSRFDSNDSQFFQTEFFAMRKLDYWTPLTINLVSQSFVLIIVITPLFYQIIKENHFLNLKNF